MAIYPVERDSCDSSLRRGNIWQLPVSKKYRSHFEIIASILDVARNNSGDRYFLMKHTSVNYAQLKKYLGSLTKIGFIEVQARGQKILYCATEKGLAFLRQYYILIGMLTKTYTLSEQGQLIYQPAYATMKKPQNPNEDSVSRYAK
jgi:predicted transcriptional regulator